MQMLVKLGLLGAAAYYLSQKLADLDKKIGVKVNSISFNKALTAAASYFKIVFNLNLTLENNSALQGDIKGGTIYVYIKDKIIATVNLNNKIVIPANNKINVSLPVAVNTLSVVPTVTALLGILQSGGGSITLRLSGNVLTSFGTVTINEQKTVTL